MSLLDKVVVVLTLDGRTIVGLLRGADPLCNLVLVDSHERVFSSDKGMEQEPLGLYLVRGDSVCVVGPPLALARVQPPTPPHNNRARSPASRPRRLPHAPASAPLRTCSAVLGELDAAKDTATNWASTKGWAPGTITLGHV